MSKTAEHREWNSRTSRRVASAALTLVVSLGLGVVSTYSAQAQAYKEKVLHSFAGGADGGEPVAGLIFDVKGNLYGTTSNGGGANAGVVFKVSGNGKETVLYSFTGGADGGYPYYGSLILDAKGNLYGTTNNGGISNQGVVFKVSSNGKETVLHRFTGGTDGAYPRAGLIMDAKGNLYGITSGGGGNGGGVVFKVGSKGKETVLYTFAGGMDGAYSQAGLIMDAKGNLYGTTYEGGGSNAGVVFKVSSKGEETILYDFTGGADGGEPDSPLILDTKGNLYGTTWDGGAANLGVVFRVSSKGKETVLHSFTGVDGANSNAPLILDTKGNLYGTTSNGGGANAGVVFKVSRYGKETVLYSFTGGAGGGNPFGGLILDAKGNRYGTTATGGASGDGTVLKLTQ